MSGDATDRPVVSALIVTRNRHGCIASAVESVLANAYPSFDLTVVDQSETAATFEALRPYIDGDPRIQYIHLDRPGVSRACNVGIRSSTGEIIAFTDDDCIVPSGWLAAIVAAFAGDPDADLLYGQVLPPRCPRQADGVTPSLTLRRPWRLSCHDRLDGVQHLAFGGMGANFAARRRLFEAIGGFDELLGPGTALPSSQDFDIAYRAFCAGSTIIWRPEVSVVHEYGTRARDEWAQKMCGYGLGDGGFYFKHVRCGDVFILRFLSRRIVNRGGRGLAKLLLRRDASGLNYSRSLLIGIWCSLRFGVDTRTRLFVPRSRGAD